jgi:hypothetical protein
VGRSGESSNMETYIAPYVQVRHAIHLLYATSPHSRDGADDAPAEASLNGRDEPAAPPDSDGDVSEPTPLR